MAASTVTTFDKMLKLWYEPGRVKLQAYDKNPLLALMPKDENMRGKSRVLPIWFGAGQGVAAKFATAQANKSSGQYENFVLTRVKGYGIGGLDNELIEAAKGGDKAAFMEATNEIDGLKHQVTRDLAIAQYGTPNGARGTIAAFEDTDTGGGDTDDIVVLTNKSDVVNFEVGMKVLASTGGVSGGVRTAYTIAAIDRSNGKLTFVDSAGASVDLDTDPAPTPWAISDTLHREGDIDTTDDDLKLSGLAAWLPFDAPGSTLFFGVDRSVDTERLAGVRVDGSSMSVEDALIELSTGLRVAGASPEHCFLNPIQVKHLIRELGSKVEHDIVKSPDMARIGFKSIVLHTPAGQVKVVEDPNCPVDRGYMLTMSDWKLYSMGGAPRMLTYAPGDGARWLRESDDDAVEYRVGWYGQMGCKAPGRSGVVKLSA